MSPPDPKRPEEGEAAAAQEAERGYWLPDGYVPPTSGAPPASGAAGGMIAAGAAVLLVAAGLAAHMASTSPALAATRARILLARGRAMQERLDSEAAAAAPGDAGGAALARRIDVLGSDTGVGGTTSAPDAGAGLGIPEAALPANGAVDVRGVDHAFERVSVESLCDGAGDICYALAYRCCGARSAVIAFPRDDAVLDRLREEVAGKERPALVLRERTIFLVFGEHDPEALVSRLGIE